MAHAALAIPTPQLPATLEATAERAKEYGRNAKSASTHRAYRSDVADFRAWCTSRGLEPLPATPQTLALYLTAQAETGRKIATIRRRVAAIGDLHTTAGFENPAGAKVVREIVRGIAREKGTAPRKKAALTVDGLRAALRPVDAADLRALRDRALLLVGFHGALRRSEIAALQWQDFDFERQQLLEQRSIVNGQVDDVKTEYSRDHVPLHEALVGVLLEWSKQALPTEEGWVFASPLTNRPYQPTEIQKRHLRPAGWCLVECPKCGVGSGVWCRQDRPTPNGARLPSTMNAGLQPENSARLGGILSATPIAPRLMRPEHR